MKLYKMNKRTLLFEEVNNRIIYFSVALFLFVSAITTFLILTNINQVRLISGETKTLILNEQKEFSKEKLKTAILELNLKYPHIVYAQAVLESGSFTSKVFKENNNFFGLKIATQRPTTNKGAENGYAFYNSWFDCLVDYAMYNAKYLSKINNEDEYFEYLKQNYAQDPTYVNKLKNIIEKENKKY